MGRFAYNTLTFFPRLGFYSGTYCMLGQQARQQTWRAFNNLENGVTSRVNTSIRSFFGVDSSDQVYNQVSYVTQTGLELASMAVAGKGLIQGAAKLAKRAVVFKSAVKLNPFHEAVRNLPKTAQNNIRILRGWAKSKRWHKLPNPEGRPEMWGIYKENGKFSMRLSIRPKPGIQPGLDRGSSIPRFDAKLEEGKYINPFTGELGTYKRTSHIPLEQVFYE